ncbi:hypothetical protein H4R35_003296 [Dimargaris xerosporica]|nr:hypothetical protein H4R35_003296 [Dimargaris xerosporica]
MRAVLSCLAVGLLISGWAQSHIYVADPCIRKSPEKSCGLDSSDVDYDANAPISTYGESKTMGLCRGAPKKNSVKTYTAGETVVMKFNDGATHKGGHCEFSLSVDDKVFVAIRTILKDCFVNDEGTNIKIQIPENAPTLKGATLAWTWVNAEGNREFYMNCIDVDIEGKPDGKIEGHPIVIANYGKDSKYPLIEEFAHGKDPRLDLYNNRGNITLTSNGSTASRSGSGESFKSEYSKRFSKSDKDSGSGSEK